MVVVMIALTGRMIRFSTTGFALVAATVLA